MKIIHYNKAIKSRDNRFSDKLWCEGSDPRINTQKRTRKPRGAKRKGISRAGAFLYCLFLITIICWYKAPKNVQEVVESKVVPEAQAIAPVPVPVAPLTIEDKIRATFGDKGEQAIKVATCESGLDPQNTNPKTFDLGLFQINYGTWYKTFGKNVPQYYNEDRNIEMAHTIYLRSGNWSAWSSSSKCHKLN